MKTLTFYSYKGGVGRTLALTNMALRLVEYGKKVAILDFDLEAPGIPFKLSRYFSIPKFEKGIVDYIYEFSENKFLFEDLKKFSFELPARNKYQQPIHVIPAGALQNNEYWKKLSKINWHDLFYSENPMGVAFFLDLKEQIKNQFKPDYLLIDSRTGITDISGITLRLLADDIVILAANNAENLFGSKQIIKNLLDKDKALKKTAPKVHFILTRLPFGNLPQERVQENELIAKTKIEFENHIGIQNFDINILHSDRRLEINERVLIGDKLEENKISIENDYLNLFYKIFKEYITDNEIEKFNTNREADLFYLKAKENNLKPEEAIKFIDKAIALNSNNYLYYYHKSMLLLQLGQYEESIKCSDKALELNNEDELTLQGKTIALYNLDKYNDALEIYEKLSKINPTNDDYLFQQAFLNELISKVDTAMDLYKKVIQLNPHHVLALNQLANYSRRNHELTYAYNYITKAIEINTESSMLFSTLAEVYAEMGKTEEFYLNLTIALSKGIDAESLNLSKDVYMKFKDELRFINLIQRYGIDIDEILK